MRVSGQTVVCEPVTVCPVTNRVEPNPFVPRAIDTAGSSGRSIGLETRCSAVDPSTYIINNKNLHVAYRRELPLASTIAEKQPGLVGERRAAELRAPAARRSSN